eukprot:CAMPEP_0113704502 /NCGR_PEP_ID=MMETSP0038_2-20120614/26557_1 /TAXON_ID=2898 /ORGANISM="Cryptomonas paramecium" /LENGTH=46 /DNA_ID=CAMNT_0000629295 /DNA_START=65 /DNA_END=201 /DNA_ORIENTATION=+ /assembly_acc=CAM_ASM_000170
MREPNPVVARETGKTTKSQDGDWIYADGPTGHLHDVYFNQYDELDT